MSVRHASLRSCARGFSLTELMLVVGILGIALTMAVIQIGQMQQGLKGDGGMRVLIAQLTTAREMAITERRNMRLTFTNPNVVSIIREEAPGPATTTLRSTPLEGGIAFSLIADQPDTPDAFGRPSAVAFGTATEIKFGPEGTLLDQDGGTLNGTVFLAIPDLPLSSRAVTILGSTGRIRGYRWDGAAWKLV